MAAPKSKVARLPFAVRQELNRRLLDGAQGPSILPWLNEHTDTVKLGLKFNAQNLTVWRRTGFAKWLAEQGKSESLKEMAEHYMRLAEASGGNLSEGGLAIAAGKLLARMEGADGEDLDALVKALAAIRDRELLARGVAVQEKKVEQGAKKLTLQEAEFQRRSAELFVKWHADKKAREIADSKAPTEIKVRDLVKRVFGDKPSDIP